MAQDQEPVEDQPSGEDVEAADATSEEVDTSHALDMVTLYQSQTVDAEMEADVIHGILESNGIQSMVVRPTGFLNLGCEVRVPRASLEEAQRLVAEAQAGGPEAAADAEAASEEA